jgi:hypothetical protein
MQESEAGPLAANPALEGIRRLDLSGHPCGDSFLRVLALSPHVQRLEQLHIPDLGVGPAGARHLAASPQLRNLHYLNLSGNQIGPEGLVRLLESPHLARLDSLSLNGRPGATNTPSVANVGSAGVMRLAGCPGSARLRALRLFHNRLDDTALFALARSPYLDGLLELSLYLHENGGPAVSALQERFGHRLPKRIWVE